MTISFLGRNLVPTPAQEGLTIGTEGSRLGQYSHQGRRSRGYSELRRQSTRFSRQRL